MFKIFQQFQQIKIAGMFIHMNVGKYGLATLIRFASSPFCVFQENDQRTPTGFQITLIWRKSKENLRNFKINMGNL